MRNLSIFILLLCFTLSTLVFAKPLHIAFFNPGKKDQMFWNNCTDYMRAAAKDFDIVLDVYWSDRNRVKIIQQVSNSMKSNKPDYIIIQNLKSSAPDILKIAQKSNVGVFLFNSGLSDREKKSYKGPREFFSNWVGELMPSDKAAGYDQLKTLVELANNKTLKNNDGKIELLALAGTSSDTSASERIKGLNEFLSQNEDVKLNRNPLPGHWSRKTAKLLFELAFKSFPHTNIVWCANDDMALGVLDTLENTTANPGKNILIGGVDWNSRNLEEVKSGRIAASVGGHFMDAAWSIVILYDLYNGIDFKDSEGLSMNSKMSVLTQDNVSGYFDHVKDKDPNNIDFTKFSKKIHPEIKKYDFSLNKILKQFKN